MNIVEVTELAKSYGAAKAVDSFSFTAAQAQIVALVGPDGAGKTTLFRAMCGLIAYDSGRIQIAGHDVAKQFRRIKPLLGYMPQTFSLYPDLSVDENLRFYAGLFGLGRAVFRQRRERMFGFSGLRQFSGRRAAALSGGMKQKLALSCALMHDPSVLILDEPTTGVDPLSRRQFWEMLKNLRIGGATIVVSTAYMDEVAMSDRTIFIHQGRKLIEGTPAELVRGFRGGVYRVRNAGAGRPNHQLNQIDGLSVRRFGLDLHLYVQPGRELVQFRSELMAAGIAPDSAEPIQPDLEDVFIQHMETRP